MKERIVIRLQFETEAQRQMMIGQIAKELLEGYKVGWNSDATTKKSPFKFNYQVEQMEHIKAFGKE